MKGFQLIDQLLVFALELSEFFKHSVPKSPLDFLDKFIDLLLVGCQRQEDRLSILLALNSLSLRQHSQLFELFGPL